MRYAQVVVGPAGSGKVRIQLFYFVLFTLIIK